MVGVSKRIHLGVVVEVTFFVTSMSTCLLFDTPPYLRLKWSDIHIHKTMSRIHSFCFRISYLVDFTEGGSRLQLICIDDGVLHSHP